MSIQQIRSDLYDDDGYYRDSLSMEEIYALLKAEDDVERDEIDGE